MPARIFVPLDFGKGQRLQPEAGGVDENIGRDLGEHAGADRDMGAGQFAAMQASGQQQMTALKPKERHRGVGFDRDAAHRAGGAVDAGGHVDGDDILAALAPPFIEPRDQFRRRPVDIARQPRAKQRVDHQIGSVEGASFGGLNLAVPGRRRGQRVAP